MDPGVGFSLEYKCIVTYSLPGDYFYDKWWVDFASLAIPRRKGEGGNT